MGDILENFKGNYSSLKGCCMEDPKGLFDKVIEVLYFIPSIPDEEQGAAVCKLWDASYACFEEWQDYSGHGCQCGALVTGPFDTLEDAIRLGLGDDSRTILNIPDPEEE